MGLDRTDLFHGYGDVGPKNTQPEPSEERATEKHQTHGREQQNSMQEANECSFAKELVKLKLTMEGSVGRSAGLSPVGPHPPAGPPHRVAFSPVERSKFDQMQATEKKTKQKNDE